MRKIINIVLVAILLTSCATSKKNKVVPGIDPNFDNLVLVDMINTYRKSNQVSVLKWSDGLKIVASENLSTNVNAYDSQRKMFSDDDFEITGYSYMNGIKFKDLSISLFSMKGDRLFHNFMKEYYPSILDAITVTIKTGELSENGFYDVSSSISEDVYYYEDNLLVVDSVNGIKVARYHGTKNIANKELNVYASKTLSKNTKAKLKACYMVYLITKDLEKKEKLLSKHFDEVGTDIHYDKSYIMFNISLK